ncbi:MAG: pyrroline-5-carboxylate reductase [Phycisphaerae bacterium]|jgi:pyrroline-5-carboxylate reductase
MAEHLLGVIGGGGNMAEAILRGIVRSGFLPPEAIIVSDPAEARRDLISRTLNIAAVADNAQPARCPRILLAVKPQMMSPVLEGIAPHVTAGATVISIAAGVPTARIDGLLGGRGHIVRVMPNTPMLVGAGVSAIAAGPRAGKSELDWTEKLFSTAGLCCRVEESMIDAVTAVSGSGPAYFCYLVEAMIAAGVAEGLPADVATLLATSTCAGTGQLMLESADRPEVLRAKVTSPGGTTQRAIETMEAAGVKDALVAAIRAAAARSRELGK